MVVDPPLGPRRAVLLSAGDAHGAKGPSLHDDGGSGGSGWAEGNGGESVRPRRCGRNRRRALACDRPSRGGARTGIRGCGHWCRRVVPRGQPRTSRKLVESFSRCSPTRPVSPGELPEPCRRAGGAGATERRLAAESTVPWESRLSLRSPFHFRAEGRKGTAGDEGEGDMRCVPGERR